MVKKIEKYSDLKEKNENNLKDNKKRLIWSAIAVGALALATVSSLIMRGEINFSLESLVTASGFASYLGYNIAKRSGLKRQGEVIEQTADDWEKLAEDKGKAR